MSRPRSVCCAALLALLSNAVMSAAQVRVVRYGDDRLTGITEVDVLVMGALSEGLCTVRKAAVEKASVEALTASSIKATVSAKARSTPYSVVIEVITRETTGKCATGLTTELVAEVSGIPEADRSAPPGAWGSLLVGAMPLTHDNALVIGPALEHDAAVQRDIAKHVAAIAARIRAANK